MVSKVGEGWIQKLSIAGNSCIICCMSRDRQDEEDAPIPAHRSGARSATGLMLRKNQVGLKVEDFYKLDDKLLGEGGFGTVRKAWLKGNSPTIGKSTMVRACKTIKKTTAKHDALVHAEVEVLQSLDHPAVCRLLETFEDNKQFFLIMEFIDGRELFTVIEERLAQKQPFEEARAAGMLRQVFGALGYCHAHNVVHRDLKPENIMVLKGMEETPRDAVPPIKIIDFGLAVLSRGSGGIKKNVIVGTPEYMSPEAQKGHSVAVSDCWSVGVILHVILLGTMPKRALRGDSVPALKSTHCPPVSEAGANLLRELLQTDPKKRITAEKAHRHPWTSQQAPGDPGFLPPSTKEQIEGMHDAFTAFRKSCKLRQAALTAMATQLSGQTILHLQEQFHQIDKDSSGHIDKEELIQAFLADPPPGVSDPRAWAADLFDSVDLDNSGEIEFTEFQAAALHRLSYQSDEAIHAAFRVFDRDNSGVITHEDLKCVLHESEDAIKDLIDSRDTNGDGVLSYDEFKAMILGSPTGASQERKMQMQAVVQKIASKADVTVAEEEHVSNASTASQ